MKKLSLKASCLCGGIQLRTHGYHRDVENCHCIQCMKTHGNYAAYTNVQEQNVKFFKKTTLKWFRSSKKAKRGFCRKCGASLFFKIIGSNIILGSFFNTILKSILFFFLLLEKMI